MNTTDILLLIVIATVTADLVMLHAEIRRHREYERRTRPKLAKLEPEPLVIEIKCDTGDAMAKIEQLKVAAQAAADVVGRLGPGALQ